MISNEPLTTPASEPVPAIAPGTDKPPIEPVYKFDRAGRRYDAAARSWRMKESRKKMPPRYQRTVRLVDQVLSPEDLKTYHTMLRDRRVTIPEIRAFLATKNIFQNDLTTRRHRRDQFKTLHTVRQAAEMACAFVEVSRENGSPGIASEAALTHVEQQLMQTFFNVLKAQQKGEVFDAKTWEGVIKVLSGLVRSREVMVAIEKLLTPNPGKKPKGDSPQTLTRIRQILGLDVNASTLARREAAAMLA